MFIFKCNLLHLAEAFIHLPSSCFESMVQLFRVLQNIHSLKLSSLFLSSFAVELQKDLRISECIQSPFCNLRKIKFGTTFSDGEILVMNNILNLAPHIEALFVENEVGKNPCIVETTGEHFKDEKAWFVYKSSSLKLIEIQHFQASENEVKFIKSSSRMHQFWRNWLSLLQTRAQKIMVN
ncbi:hypothetical protein ACHQM5_025047 [Ranunculus cassubicifolius]